MSTWNLEESKHNCRQVLTLAACTNTIGKGIVVVTTEFDYTSNIIPQCWHKKHRQSTSSNITVRERNRLMFSFMRNASNTPSNTHFPTHSLIG